MFKLAFKDIKLTLADKKGLLLAFALPIALITLFALAFGGMDGGDKKAKPRKIVIVDADKSIGSKRIVDAIDSLTEFTVIRTTIDTAEIFIHKGDEAAALVILSGAGDSLSHYKFPAFEFLYDEARGPEVAILQGALVGQLSRIIGSEFAPPDTSVNALKKPEEKKSFISARSVMREKENSPGLVQAVAGTAVMMLLFSVAGIGESILEEKQEGTLKRLLYSPLHANHILFGKLIFANMISVAQLLIMFIFAWLAFGLEIFSKLPQLFITILATAYACSSFGVMLAAAAKSKKQVQGMATLIILVMSAIGGSMIPSFVMPEFMQNMGVISVNYWSIQSFFDIFWRQIPITDFAYLQRILVLFLIGTVCNGIAFVFFKKNVLKLT